MANYCWNELVITGEQSELNKLIEYVEGETVFDFNKIKPAPSDLTSLAENGKPELLNWQVTNWGCKWNMSPEDFIEFIPGEGIVEYKFDTPWNPVVPLIDTLASKFPELEFTLRHIERANEEAGIAEWARGSRRLHIESKYEEDFDAFVDRELGSNWVQNDEEVEAS